MKRALVAGAAAALALVASPARAQVDPASDSITLRVRQGDSLELVAAELYGDKALASFLLADNKLTKPRPLHAGERLRVPVTRDIVTAKGDTFESLAATYLGDPRRGIFLAEFNAMSIEDNLATGTPLTIPLRVVHVATANESLAAVALQYFGDAKQADMLKRYNFLDHSAIEKGESIVVPNLHVHVRGAKLPGLDAAAKERRDKQKHAVDAAALALPAARAAWLAGDYTGVAAALLHIVDETDYLDVKTAVEIGLLAARAHVAFDETDAAVAAFAQVLDRKPRLALSAYAESPKVLAAWRKAGGHVEGE